MARLRKTHSRILDKACARAAAISSLSDPPAQGPITLARLQRAFADTRQALDHYNRKLAEADLAQNQFLDEEARLNDIATRLFSGVRAKFGKRSRQFIQAGGKPPSLRRRRRKSTPPPESS